MLSAVNLPGIVNFGESADGRDAVLTGAVHDEAPPLVKIQWRLLHLTLGPHGWLLLSILIFDNIIGHESKVSR